MKLKHFSIVGIPAILSRCSIVAAADCTYPDDEVLALLNDFSDLSLLGPPFTNSSNAQNLSSAELSRVWDLVDMNSGGSSVVLIGTVQVVEYYSCDPFNISCSEFVPGSEYSHDRDSQITLNFDEYYSDENADEKFGENEVNENEGYGEYEYADYAEYEEYEEYETPGKKNGDGDYDGDYNNYNDGPDLESESPIPKSLVVSLDAHYCGCGESSIVDQLIRVTGLNVGNCLMPHFRAKSGDRVFLRLCPYVDQDDSIANHEVDINVPPHEDDKPAITYSKESQIVLPQYNLNPFVRSFILRDDESWAPAQPVFASHCRPLSREFVPCPNQEHLGETCDSPQSILHELLDESSNETDDGDIKSETGSGVTIQEEDENDSTTPPPTNLATQLATVQSTEAAGNDQNDNQVISLRGAIRIIDAQFNTDIHLKISFELWIHALLLDALHASEPEDVEINQVRKGSVIVLFTVSNARNLALVDVSNMQRAQNSVKSAIQESLPKLLEAASEEAKKFQINSFKIETSLEDDGTASISIPILVVAILGGTCVLVTLFLLVRKRCLVRSSKPRAEESTQQFTFTKSSSPTKHGGSSDGNQQSNTTRVVSLAIQIPTSTKSVASKSPLRSPRHPVIRSPTRSSPRDQQDIEIGLTEEQDQCSSGSGRYNLRVETSLPVSNV